MQHGCNSKDWTVSRQIIYSAEWSATGCCRTFWCGYASRGNIDKLTNGDLYDHLLVWMFSKNGLIYLPPEKLAGIFIDLDLIERLNFTTGMYYCSQGWFDCFIIFKVFPIDGWAECSNLCYICYNTFRYISIWREVETLLISRRIIMTVKGTSDARNI